MFNGLSNQIRNGLAGFIAACLLSVTISPLFTNRSATPTSVAANRVLPEWDSDAKDSNITGTQADEDLNHNNSTASASSQAIPATDWRKTVTPTTNNQVRQSMNYNPNSQSNQPKPTNNNQSQTVDLYLLARVIHAEGRGEPFEGQVAIGAVLLNRLRDSRFPKTLQQIIFKRGEFCTVRDGQIWLPPNDEAIRAAKLAVAGWDPTGGALYFYNPAKTTSKWIWNRPITNRIGRHVFAA